MALHLQTSELEWFIDHIATEEQLATLTDDELAEAAQIAAREAWDDRGA